MSYQRTSKYNTKSVNSLHKKAKGSATKSQPASTLSRLLFGKKGPDLPAQLSGYEYTVEGGLKRRKQRNWHSKIVSASMLSILPLAWWLNSSNAFYEPLKEHSVLQPQQTENKAALALPQLAQHPLNLKSEEIEQIVDEIEGITEAENRFSLPETSIVPLALPTAQKASLLGSALNAPESIKHVSLSPLSPLQEDKTEEISREHEFDADGFRQVDLKVNAGDSLSLIFERNKLSRSQMHEILALKKYKRKLLNLYPDQKITIQHDPKGNIENIKIGLSFNEELRISRDNDGFSGKIQQRDIKTEQVAVAGTINSSLFAAGQKAGLSNRLILNMVKILRWNIDFINNIQPGDHFTVVYERHTDDNNKTKDGDILAVEFVNQGKTHRAVRYTNKSGKTKYYNPNGRSLRKAFLRTPVKFSRISSYFTRARRHPVLNRIRAHKGIDYAAPKGTPIYAVGDARVKSVGRQRGYGNTVVLQHDKSHSTLYAHMNHFAKGLKKGQRVKQGQVIGYVGKTGLATGYHLHYEFHVNGVHKNPLRVKLPRSRGGNTPVQKQKDFIQKTRGILAKLDEASQKVVVQKQLKVANVDKDLVTPTKTVDN